MLATPEAPPVAAGGPRTPQGKDRSRRNSLRHGLSGNGRVISEEDRPAVDQRSAEFLAELAPRSTIGLAMVGQLAILSVRMDRAARQETQALASRVRHAVEAFDHGRVDEAEGRFETLGENPRKNLRLLRRSPEGVERLIEAWGELREDLTRPGGPLWSAGHRATIGHLLGQRFERFAGSPLDDFGRAVLGEEAGLIDREWLALDPEGRRARAVAELVRRIDAEIAGLEAHYETLDFETIELDRRDAADVALFDASREACLARRYEAEASRRFFKALKEFRQAETDFEARPASKPQASPEPKPVPVPVAEPVSSFRAGASSKSVQSERVAFEPVSCSPVPSNSDARGLDGRVIAVGRAVVMPR